MIGTYAAYATFPLIFIAAIILALTFYTKKEDPAYRFFCFLCAIVLKWNIVQTLSATLLHIPTAEFFFRMQFLFIPFVTVAILMFTLKILGIDKALSFKYIFLMCLIPSVTVIMNFTNDFHHLFRTSFSIVQMYPIRVIENVRGPWFWVNVFYSYSASMTTVFVLIYKIKSVAKAQKFQYYILLIGNLVGIAANLFIILNPTALIDVTAWGTTLGLLFWYIAMNATPSSNFVLARNQVFESIGEYIFVLDLQDNIRDINQSAKNWLARHGVNSVPPTLNKLLQRLQEQGATIENDEDVGRWELFFLDEQNSLFSSFSIKRSSVYEKNQIPAGFIVTFSDMTVIGETLRNLRAISTVDELTGTYNRRGYEKMLVDYDKDNHLPLCVIIGDVNHLKHVNDTLGHNVGDEVLKGIARLLVECTLGRGMPARIGGDEFAIVIPNFGEADAENLKNDIRKAFVAKAGRMHGAGIALGHAVKSNTGEELLKIIDEADKRMYEDKRNDRRAPRS